MKKVYKITTKELTTYGGFKWEVGKWYKTSGMSPFCGRSWLHCYAHPDIAVLMNPIYGCYEDYILWEAEAKGEHRSDHGLKEGYTEMRLVKQIEIPVFTPVQKVAFARICVKKMDYKERIRSIPPRDDMDVAYAAHRSAKKKEIDFIALAKKCREYK